MSAIIALALLALLLLGFWVGAFETFGGYQSRQRVFLWISLGIGLGVALLSAELSGAHAVATRNRTPARSLPSTCDSTVGAGNSCCSRQDARRD
jgi:hypothetical protein